MFDTDEHKTLGWPIINRLRLKYRIARGDEENLRAQIIWLSALCDYPAKSNDALFRRVNAMVTGPVGSGFGCWLRD